MTLDQNGVLVACSSCGTMNRLKYAGLERASKCGKCQSLLPFPAEPIEVRSAQLFDAVIAGIKPERDGALIRKVEGHPNHPPSSEAVEMIGMDLSLPKITLKDGAQVPVIRSKLHGHRGVRAFDWTRVEYVPLPESYLHYPVSCSTDAQYRAVQEAFSNSYALRNPEDPRQLVFTVLPGHGMVLVEKWVEGKAPFQLMWEAMDSKIIEITNHIPQGPFAFETHGQHCRITGNSTAANFELPHEH